MRVHLCLRHVSLPTQHYTIRSRLQPELARSIATVSTTSSANVEEFRKRAFSIGIPLRLIDGAVGSFPASKKWFLCQNSKDIQLNQAYFSRFETHTAPLEITRRMAGNPDQVEFEKVEAPLSLLLKSLIADVSQENTLRTSIYLAQHDLLDLPSGLREDLPTPDLVTRAGKGDVYSSSLWLGRAPTYTPLHRDPNPNLFVQLAGTKTVRLFRPEIGSTIFDLAQHMLDAEGGKCTVSNQMSATLRGQEMMQGEERQLLHRLIWPEQCEGVLEITAGSSNGVLEYGLEATVHAMDALFIPKGWWHSIISVGHGVNASANWWFR